MARKYFDEVLKETGVDIKDELVRLKIWFYDETYNDELYAKYVIPYDFVSQNFKYVTFRKTFTNIDDFDKNFNFNFYEFPNDDNALDYLIDFCEYIFNLTYSIWKNKSNIPTNNTYEYNADKNITHYIFEQLNNLIDLISYKVYEYEEFIRLIPKSQSAIAVSEIVETELSSATLHYNHHSLKGDLGSKRDILNKMAQYLEPQREELKSINSDLYNNIFFIFNKFHIRHNNKDGSKKYKICAAMTDNELEDIYDDAYQLWLLSVLELDNIERTEKIANLRKLPNE